MRQHVPADRALRACSARTSVMARAGARTSGSQRVLVRHRAGHLTSLAVMTTTDAADTPATPGAPRRARKAVIPAAGLGTRFIPATKAVPKELLPVVDVPALEYIVAEAAREGLGDVLVVTGRGKDAIENHFDSAPEVEAGAGEER